jgi:hypothetical protein
MVWHSLFRALKTNKSLKHADKMQLEVQLEMQLDMQLDMQLEVFLPNMALTNGRRRGCHKLLNTCGALRKSLPRTCLLKHGAGNNHRGLLHDPRSSADCYARANYQII